MIEVLFNAGPWRRCGSTWALKVSTPLSFGRRSKIWSSKPSLRECPVVAALFCICGCAHVFLQTELECVVSSHGRSDPYVNSLVKMHVRSSYSCHELFGFDIMLDENLKPWVLEVNISPRYGMQKVLELKLFRMYSSQASLRVNPNSLSYPFPLVLRVHVRVRAVPILVFIEG